MKEIKLDEKDIFDHSKDFNAECLKAIIQLKKFCLSRGIPFYMAFAVKNNNENTDYIVAKQLPPECETTLKNDLFRNIILAERGFDLAENHIDSFNMEDIPLPPMCDLNTD